MQPNDSHTVAQAVHDLGSALWFGGATMGAVGVNHAGRDLPHDIDRIRVASAGWSRYRPLQWAGVAATIAAGLRLTRASTGRLAAQRSFSTVGTVKAGVTALGALATAYAAYSGAKIAALAEQAQGQGRELEITDATNPSEHTDERLAAWQRRQRMIQYVVPALAGANIALGSYLAASYRPRATAKGILGRLRPD